MLYRHGFMDSQELFNLAFSAGMACAGWFARQLWEATERLKGDIKSIEIDLPTNYVRKVDIEARFDKIDLALARIYDLIDRKQDKIK